MNTRSEVALLWMAESDGESETRQIAAVVARAAAGDSAAFEQLVVRHERRVLTLSFRLLGSMEDAQDAAQEVFLRTFKYLHRFDTRRPFEPWLVRLTVNVCRDLGRSQRRRAAVIVEHNGKSDVAEPRDSSSNPHADLQSDQLRETLYRALADLPEKERTAFVLRDIEGLSTAETADVLGSSEATVRSQISSARLKLRKFITRTEAGK